MSHPMRRSDRNITDPAQIRSVLEACQCCRVGFYDNGEIFIVPLNFGYAEENGKLVLYFHGASAGRKQALIESCPTVGFEMDCGYALKPAELACSHTAQFQSIIGTGRICPVTEQEAKIKGLTCIMEHAAGHRPEWTFASASLESVRVYRLEAAEYSCKIHE